MQVVSAFHGMYPVRRARTFMADNKHRESWAGKAVINYEITCYECQTHDYLPSLGEARKQGWKKINNKWHCRECAAGKSGEANGTGTTGRSDAP
jgi:rubredoxin